MNLKTRFDFLFETRHLLASNKTFLKPLISITRLYQFTPCEMHSYPKKSRNDVAVKIQKHPNFTCRMLLKCDKKNLFCGRIFS